MSSLPMPPKEIARRFPGPMLVGACLETFLFGVLLMQAYTYYRVSKRDPIGIKLIVVWISILTFTTASVAVYTPYNYLIMHYGEVEHLFWCSWPISIAVLGAYLSSATAQIFYAWRIRRLMNQMIVPGVIVFSVIIQLGLMMTSVIMGIFAGDYRQLWVTVPWVISWITLASATDITIAAVLCWFLRRHRTGFKKTDDLMEKAARLSVQTGAVTAIWSVVQLLVFVLVPDGTSNIFTFVLSPLYGNCLLGSLNARHEWAESMQTSHLSIPTIGLQTNIRVSAVQDMHVEEAARGPVRRNAPVGWISKPTQSGHSMQTGSLSFSNSEGELNISSPKAGTFGSATRHSDPQLHEDFKAQVDPSVSSMDSSHQSSRRRALTAYHVCDCVHCPNSVISFEQAIIPPFSADDGPEHDAVVDVIQEPRDPPQTTQEITVSRVDAV